MNHESVSASKIALQFSVALTLVALAPETKTLPLAGKG